MSTTEYKVDPDRQKLLLGGQTGTGIFVRATLEGEWDSFDIASLDSKSLLAWLRCRGGKNEWAESVVGRLLGHSSLHD